MLAHDSDVDGFAGVLQETVESFFHATKLKPGTRVGDYEIQQLIGAGGMGEVYQARDSRLARDVAIKVLPAFLTNHPDTYSRVYAGKDPALFRFDRQQGRVERLPGSDGLFGSAWSPDGRYRLAVDAADDRLFV